MSAGTRMTNRRVQTLSLANMCFLRRRFGRGGADAVVHRFLIGCTLWGLERSEAGDFARSRLVDA